jgi:ParB family chromosome partitioning protein
MTGRRVSLSTLADDPVETVPGRGEPTLTHLAPKQIARTPLNRRTNFGTEEELTELGESIRIRQLAPITVVPRAAYLRLWPKHEEHTRGAEYVLVMGERRWRAATLVKLQRIDVFIRPELADTRSDFLDALFSENFDRRNFDPLEEAGAV